MFLPLSLFFPYLMAAAVTMTTTTSLDQSTQSKVLHTDKKKCAHNYTVTSIAVKTLDASVRKNDQTQKNKTKMNRNYTSNAHKNAMES